MSTKSSSQAIDLQKLISGAAKIDLKALHAGAEYVQVWANQAALLSNIASDTLREIRDDKASLAATARRLSQFGKQNGQAFADLSNRLNTDYFDELSRLVGAISPEAKVSTPSGAAKPAATTKPAPKKLVRRAKARKAPAGAKA